MVWLMVCVGCVGLHPVFPKKKWKWKVQKKMSRYIKKKGKNPSNPTFPTQPYTTLSNSYISTIACLSFLNCLCNRVVLVIQRWKSSFKGLSYWSIGSSSRDIYPSNPSPTSLTLATKGGGVPINMMVQDICFLLILNIGYKFSIYFSSIFYSPKIHKV